MMLFPRNWRIQQESSRLGASRKFYRNRAPCYHLDPHLSLDSSANRLWPNAVPAPLGPGMLAISPSLQRPKPDLLFGYSEIAFDVKQLMAIKLLIDQKGQSYAIADKKLRFPHSGIELKSQAKCGTHFIVTNEVTSTGIVAMDGTPKYLRKEESRYQRATTLFPQ